MAYLLPDVHCKLYEFLITTYLTRWDRNKDAGNIGWFSANMCSIMS